MKRFLVSSLSLFVLQSFTPNAFADKVAIIGGGASGLVSAWLIEKDHDVTLYEAASKLGGHADTYDVHVDGKTVPIEAGAELFNDLYYVHFMKLLKVLNVPVEKFTSVSTFYSTDGKKMLVLPPYHDNTVEWKSLTPNNIETLLQLKKVVAQARKLIEKNDTTTSFQQFADSLSLSKDFKTNFLYPYFGSLWGVGPTEVQEFSAAEILRFVIEGMDLPKYQWNDLPTGWSSYVDTLSKQLMNTEVKLNAPVTQITKTNGKYAITAADGSVREYDQIIFAADSSVDSQLLSKMPETAQLSTLLGEIRYHDTKIAIHSDPRFMPSNPADWRVVNIRYNGQYAQTTLFKAWKSQTPIFKSWITYDVRPDGDKGSALPNNLYTLITYSHPYVDSHYFDVQKKIQAYQGKQGLWFAGMWTYGNASHESAVTSAIKVAEQLAPNSDRLKLID
jgi:predicted NAD/FAD-binding protein